MGDRSVSGDFVWISLKEKAGFQSSLDYKNKFSQNSTCEGHLRAMKEIDIKPVVHVVVLTTPTPKCVRMAI